MEIVAPEVRKVVVAPPFSVRVLAAAAGVDQD